MTCDLILIDEDIPSECYSVFDLENGLRQIEVSNPTHAAEAMCLGRKELP